MPRSIDWLLVIPLAVLIAFGLVGLASLGLRSEPANFSAFEHQLVAVALGAFFFFLAARVHYRAWERWWPAVVIALGVLLIGVLFSGVRIHGTRGWFSLGGWTIQPVEFAKVGFILLQAAYFCRRARLLDRSRTVIESAAITAAVVVPVLLQPDLGSALLIFITWFGMLLVFGLRRTYLFSFVAVAAIVFVVSWQFLLAPYQRDRILTTLDPNRDPQGAGYNQRQAIIAVGAGGFWGRGFGQGTQAQLRFLPEAQTDFLVAVIAEEFGFIGLSALVVAAAAVAYRLFMTARRCLDDFAAAVIVGCGILFSAQTFVNLAMNVGLAPVVGVPFPFVSGGGSAVLAFAFIFGIVVSIAMRTPLAERRAYEYDPSDEALRATLR
ncbi:MAG: FtsW/RodA/SpoVE family cell cycle protein [Candidatus Uhrbacteria bacterium]